MTATSSAFYLHQKPVVEQLCLHLDASQIRPLFTVSRAFTSVCSRERALRIAVQARRLHYSPRTACRLGLIDVVQYLHAIEKCGFESGLKSFIIRDFSQDCMDYAAEHGHLEIIKWLHANRSEGCTEWAMDGAAKNGYIDIVRWLNDNNKGCTVDAMDFAASYGHLDVVKYLHGNRNEGCTKSAMTSASAHGHLHVVQWLHINRKEGCTSYAMDAAAREGHLAVVQWLHANRPEGCTAAAMDWAAESGRLDILQYLYDYCSVGCTSYAFRWAGQRGCNATRTNVLNWLHAHFSDENSPVRRLMNKLF